MTLELAPASPKITYKEAILYCFLCNHNGHKDWRLPTRDEYVHQPEIWGWYPDDPGASTNKKYVVTPVRTEHDS